MKQLLFFLFFPIILISQNTFEPGYFINAEGVKNVGLIKNLDWKYNPTEIRFKVNENSDIEKISFENLQYFTVGSSSFEKATVLVDISTEYVNNLKNDREPEFVEETALLKIISNGEVKLYEFKDSQKHRYFISQEGQINQLVYKSYLNSKNQIVKNENYKSQLLFLLECEKVSAKDIQTLEYETSNLRSIIGKFNNCENANYVEEKKEVKKGKISLSPKIRFNKSKFSVNSERVESVNLELENDIFISYGVEFEYIFGFNNNKWGFVIFPYYEKFEDNVSNDRFKDIKINYSAIVSQFALKHYMFLNDDLKFSLNAGINISFANSNSEIAYSTSVTRIFSIDTGNFINLGLGLTFKNKFSVDFNYDVNRQLFNASNVTTEFDNMSLGLSYNLF